MSACQLQGTSLLAPTIGGTLGSLGYSAFLNHVPEVPARSDEQRTEICYWEGSTDNDCGAQIDPGL